MSSGIIETVDKMVVKDLWDDKNVATSSSKASGTTAGSGYPAFDNVIGNLKAWIFQTSPAQNEYIYFNMQMPHSMNVGTELSVHLHYMPITSEGTPGNVVWEFSYSSADIGGVFGGSETLVTSSPLSVSGTAFTHQLGQIGTISGTVFSLVSGMLLCRLCRKTSDVNDTHPASISLLDFDIHLKHDTKGSIQLMNKY